MIWGRGNFKGRKSGCHLHGRSLSQSFTNRGPFSLAEEGERGMRGALGGKEASAKESCGREARFFAVRVGKTSHPKKVDRPITRVVGGEFEGGGRGERSNGKGDP